ncbi:MAG: 7-carboxy-7-deazaguanine synthase QueE [Armatimonadetes bacterium]|nr:7-carboxy-7-deazaguanine synthase QueE [Armatimonadota bacterium]
MSVALTGWLREMFVSIQGEGLFCGRRQTFVRFAGCNLDCRYCDTPASREPHPLFCSVETSPGGSVEILPNPASIDAVLERCLALGSKSIALTGGEPLCQPEFAAALSCELRRYGQEVYLETNGTLHESLLLVLPHIDILAMDVKIPSAAGRELWKLHELFIDKAACSESFVFAKAIVTEETTEDEITYCAELIASRRRSIPLVIQPVMGEPVCARHLMKLQEAALVKLEDVRVIPQCHKILGLP